METVDSKYVHALQSILRQIQELIDAATYETQTDVAATLAYWTVSIVAGEIRDGTLAVFATTDSVTGDVIDRITNPTDLHLGVELTNGTLLETHAVLYPPQYPYLVSLRPVSC